MGKEEQWGSPERTRAKDEDLRSLRLHEFSELARGTCWYLLLALMEPVQCGAQGVCVKGSGHRGHTRENCLALVLYFCGSSVWRSLPCMCLQHS